MRKSAWTRRQERRVLDPIEIASREFAAEAAVMMPRIEAYTSPTIGGGGRFNGSYTHYGLKTYESVAISPLLEWLARRGFVEKRSIPGDGTYWSRRDSGRPFVVNKRRPRIRFKG